MFFKRKKKGKDINKNPFYNNGDTLVIYFKCTKCGEVFRSHLRKFYDIHVKYERSGGAYRLDKEFIGSKCQNRINIYADFTRTFKPISFDIIGGRFISKEEYERESQQT